jgi:type VI secretion system protein ImpM
MMAAGPAASAAFPVGWYGKIPGTGDFVSRRLPATFIEAWDAWLQRALEGSRERLGALWRDTYLSMPPWRFVLSAGLVTNNAWAGVLLPSVDAVGRYFPLTVACALPSQSVDLPATLLGADAWFDSVEQIALGAIAPKADTAAIDAALVRSAFRAEWVRRPVGRADATVPIRAPKPQMLWLELAPNAGGVAEVAAGVSDPSAAWLAEASEMFGRALLLTEALPPAEPFCAMMDGRSIEHGWGRRDLRGGGGA